jgi:hypothetical protein
MRFCRLKGFHRDFRSQKLLQAPKMDISGDKCKVLSIKELSYDLMVLIEVREYLFVCVCMLGLTLVQRWAPGAYNPRVLGVSLGISGHRTDLVQEISEPDWDRARTERELVNAGPRTDRWK